MRSRELSGRSMNTAYASRHSCSSPLTTAPRRLRGAKGSVLEGGIRVPAIVSWPGRLPAGANYSGVGMMMDVLPTVLDAVDGGPMSLPDVDGQSLLDRLRAPVAWTDADDRAVFWTQAVRRGRFKLVYHGSPGQDL